ncbi:hypothetical protein EJB05_01915, partial [Eragrostis curvula]
MHFGYYYFQFWTMVDLIFCRWSLENESIPYLFYIELQQAAACAIPMLLLGTNLHASHGSIATMRLLFCDSTFNVI